MKYRILSFIKRNIPVLLLITAVIVAVAAYSLWLQTKQVKTDRIFIAPSSRTVEEGSEVSFNIRVTTKAPVDTVTATVKYNADVLNYEKVTYTGSPFDSQIPATENNNGKVTFQVAKLGGEAITGNVLVATIVFTAKTNGTTEPALTEGNAAHAGVATNPYVKADKPLIVLLLLVTAGILLLVAAFMLIRQRKLSKGQRS